MEVNQRVCNKLEVSIINQICDSLIKVPTEYGKPSFTRYLYL